MAWNFWEQNCSDEKERAKLERSMYEPLEPLPFTAATRREFDGWTFKPWTPGERGSVSRG